MKLSAVSSYFDKESVTDAYTGAFLFKGQMLSPAEHVSGDTFRRHTLSTKDGITSPARHAVVIMGDVWLVGNNNPDGFKGYVVRRNFSLKKSTGVADLLTPGQACLAGSGLSLHIYKEYYRDSQSLPTEADLDTFWNVYCPINEAVAKGAFLREGSRVLRVRNVYEVAEGFNIAEADQFDDNAIQSITFTTNGVLNVITDTYPTVSVATTGIQTDVFKFYRFSTAAEDKQLPGDRALFVAQSAVTPTISSQVTMLGKSWRVLAVVPELDAWALHVRLS
jgi:hypothetical protein